MTESSMASSSSKTSIVTNTFWFLNWMAVLCLCAAYVAPYISPQVFWFMAFMGIAYPVFLAVNLLFILYWVLQWKTKFLLSLITILLGWNYLRALFQIDFGQASLPKSDRSLSIMSFNSRLFDLYNWNHNLESRRNIFELFRAESPDILCLQEFYSSDKGDFKNVEALLKAQKAKNYHAEYTLTLRETDHWGIITLSSYPIVGKGKIIFNTKTNNIGIYTDLKLDEDTIRVYNVHLQSIQFNYDDYRFVDDLMQNKETKQLENSKNILRRMKRAFVKRAPQVDLLAEHIKQSPHPVILCGDFNDTPTSYTYRVLSRNLKDAFIESGSGFGQTYTGKFPSFRIDYILYSENFESYAFRSIDKELSDHYPLMCNLELKK